MQPTVASRDISNVAQVNLGEVFTFRADLGKRDLADGLPTG